VARSIYDNDSFFLTDIIGTQTIANAISRNPNVERFIHMSTSEVYGSSIEIPMTEEHPLLPTTPYASAKAGADRLVYSYWRTYNIPAVIIRSFNVYGPNQHLEKVIPRFITNALTDRPLTIHGTGKYTRDWNYVTDVCTALDAVANVQLDKVVGQVINIGTGQDTSIEQIANMIVTKLNKPKTLLTHISGRPGQVDRHIASNAKAKRLLDWQPQIPFENGLEQTILWYHQNREWWSKMDSMSRVPINRNGSVEYY
jgi:dTDP-glucose 4,6-dehydratase